jgi:hypothetical protein
MTMPLGGGTPVTLAVGQQADFEAIAVDATGVYWATGWPGNDSGTVAKVALDGGTPVTLASGQSCPRDIAIGAKSVYWPDGNGGTIMSAPK